MSLASILTDTKARLSALLTYANEKTGANNASIGDAILTLCDGFGSGTETSKNVPFSFSNSVIKGFCVYDDCYVSDVTIDADNVDSTYGEYIITHNYGKIPNSMLLIRKDFIDTSEGNGIGVYTHIDDTSLASNMMKQNVVNSMLRASTNISNIYGAKVKKAIPIIEQTDSWGVKSISSTEVILNGRSNTPYITRGEYYLIMK